MVNCRTYLTSKNRFISLLVIVLINLKDWVDATCQSPQYVQLWKGSTIECTFDVDSYNIYWHKLNGSNKDPIIRYDQDNVPPISGSGFDDGSYSIDHTGSLIIFNVTTINEGTYEALVYNRKSTTYTKHSVIVQAIVISEQKFPSISVCKNQKTCLTESRLPIQLNCSFGNIRPAVELTWYIRHEGYKEIIETKQTEESNGRFTFTSISAIEVDYAFVHPLTHLVCEARGPAIGTRVLESSVFIDNSSTWDYTGSTTHYYQINTQVELQCMERNKPFTYIWEKTSNGVTEVLIFSEGGKQHVNIEQSSWHVTDSADLVLSQVDLTSEGTYICKYFDGKVFSAAKRIVTVLIAPSPPFLLSEQCQPTPHSCHITIQKIEVNFTINCEIKAVYPELNLTLVNKFPSEIKLWNQTTTVYIHNNRYYVKISVELQPLESFTCDSNKFIICLASGPGALAMNNPEKEMRISWEGCKHVEKDDSTKLTQTGIYVALAVMALFIIILSINVVILQRKRQDDLSHIIAKLSSKDRMT